MPQKQKLTYGVDFEKIKTKLGVPPNDGQKYHIDHIIPCADFDLTNAEEVKKCFSAENLQWLPAKENLSKGAKCIFYLDIDLEE